MRIWLLTICLCCLAFTNQNLEQQAQAIFKSYFVDCIPYGGVIPETWHNVSLAEMCVKITDGSHYSPKDSPDSPYSMLSVKDMEEYDFCRSNCKHLEWHDLQEMKKNDCIPQVDDILVAKDGSYLKEIFICNEQRQEAILSSIAIFRPNPNVIKPEILLYLLKQPNVRKDVADNYVSGSVLPRIVLKDFKRYSCVIPPLSEQNRIVGFLSSIRGKIAQNVKENNRLAILRDTLLPRLMSGEIDVSEVEV